MQAYLWELEALENGSVLEDTGVSRGCEPGITLLECVCVLCFVLAIGGSFVTRPIFIDLSVSQVGFCSRYRRKGKVLIGIEAELRSSFG